jgi:thioredoxin reductase (NADPH)
MEQNMSETIYDVIIIGGGPGGLTAGIYAKRAAMHAVLIEKGAPGGQIINSDEVENYPGYEHISGAELGMKFSQHADSYGLEVVGREVSSIVPGAESHTVQLDNGTKLNAHAVILGTGGNPRKLDIPGESEFYGKGVSYCAVCDGFFFRGKTVVVVGGGDSAAEEALYLAKITEKVYIAHRRDALRAGMLLQQRVFDECKIEMLWNTVLTSIKANDDGVYAVDLKDTQTSDERELPIDGVFIFIGFEPNNAIVPAGIKMSVEGNVITDEKCETTIPGIYAIGDLREKYARQILTAAADGCVAALASAHYVESKKAQDACRL